METKQTCLNCQHFIRHYVKYKSHFLLTQFGHCAERRAAPKGKESVPYPEKCPLWELARRRPAARNLSVKRALARIGEHLSEIAELLKADAEEQREINKNLSDD